MQPLTQEEIGQANAYIAGASREVKDEILSKVREGDSVFLPYIRNLINQ